MRWLARLFLCRLGFHLFDDGERSWPVPNPDRVIYFHCGRCQKTTHHSHGPTGYVQRAYEE